jgi:hypothetical protein
VGESPAWDAPLRLLGGLHYLVLEGEAEWDDVPSALTAYREFLRTFVAEHSVQTNEVQRCWALLPCFLEIARRTDVDVFDLIELGSSAGLLLYWDRYRYRYRAAKWGDAGAMLELGAEERRAVPESLLHERPVVRGRVGIDLEPVDVTTDEGLRLLSSFVWADQHERLERLARAADALRHDPPRLVRGDFVELLPDLLAARRDDGLTVVLQVASSVYLTSEGRARLRETVRAAGASGPLAMVSTTQPEDGSHYYWGLRISLWPGGSDEIVAHADFHGSWLEWL